MAAQVALGPRIPGSQARRDCAQYVAGTLEGLGLNVTFHDFDVAGVPCQNVLAKLNQDPAHRRVVVLGAHYDTRKVADKDPVPENRDDPVPGANDGASGVAVLLELAKAFADHASDLSVQVWFTFFDAEDQGGGAIPGFGWCDGSERFVADLDQFLDDGLNASSLDAMILLDMVGGTNLEFVWETRSTPALRQAIFDVGRLVLGHGSAFPAVPKQLSVIDDHVAFLEAGVPAVDLIVDFTDASPDGWPHHHRTTDDLSNVDQNSLQVTGETVEAFFQLNYWLKEGESPDDLPGGTGGDWRGATSSGATVAASPAPFTLAWAAAASFGLVGACRGARRRSLPRVNRRTPRARRPSREWGRSK